MNSHRVEKVVFNDRLGYAVVYYHPTTTSGVQLPRCEDICEHRRRQALQPFDDPIDEKFCDEIEAMVRKREREAASKEIENICEKINDLFNEVEEQDLKHRDILNPRVREQIKGKTADQICDIILKDVYNHTNPIYNRIRKQDSFPHKMKYKILSASIRRAQSPPPERLSKKILKENQIEAEKEKEENGNAIKRLEKYMDENVMTEVYGRKYTRLIDKIQDDIKILKRRCTDKIQFK
ncbi:hypothetical protein PVAND_008406 [Polypedilum vanderplanki]|uniref:Uncharacterized protein n=1 Tax=Polypedilum vanderplanki TaxID=319348 RepID=A0A9J6C9N1_POLVA|nr:hypothetical protein PVAND_008406 [Polypedilum vanderplanki]